MSERIFIQPDAVVGKLKAIQKVLPSDPRVLAANTPESYIKQGSLWECQCECGSTCFVSEYCLSRNKAKSCGCIRLGMMRRKFAEGANKQKLTMVRAEIRSLMREYHAARGLGNVKEEIRLFDLIVAARKREKSMTLEVKK